MIYERRRIDQPAPAPCTVFVRCDAQGTGDSHVCCPNDRAHIDARIAGIAAQYAAAGWRTETVELRGRAFDLTYCPAHAGREYHQLAIVGPCPCGCGRCSTRVTPGEEALAWQDEPQANAAARFAYIEAVRVASLASVTDGG